MNPQVTHVSKYPGPITAMGIAPDCSMLAVGTGNGLLSLRKRAKPRSSILAAGADGNALQQKRRKEPR